MARAHPGKRIALYFEDEARFGRKGRSCHRWWLRGLRPTVPVDQGYTFAYVFAAVEPASGRDFCLVLRVVSTVAMTEFLQRFAATLPEDEHAVMVLDGAGWHTSHELVIPPNVTLPRLPPYSAERVWLYLRERHLSHRVHEGYTAIVDAVCDAWRKLTPQRLRSLCGYSRIAQVSG